MANNWYSLFTGEVNGKFSEVFTTIKDLNKKHNFAFVVIVGNLFAEPGVEAGEENGESTMEGQDGGLSKLFKGEIEIPVTTYFSLGDRPLPAAAVEKLQANDGELCPNLFTFGRRQTIKTSEGFKLVAVGGKYAAGTDEPMSPYEATFNDADAQTAGKDIDQADILVTSDWPASIQTGSKQTYKGTSPKGTQCIADLCTRLKPRYHFSASESYFERPPFFQPGDSPRHVTRFISLAPFGNAAKEKSFYACNIEPNQPPKDVPAGCTESPLLQGKKRKLDSQQDSFNSFRYANGGDDRGREHGRRKRRGRDTYAPPGPDQCFFCLSNENVGAHMIGAVEENAYIATAKGPLTTSNTFKSRGLDIPCHMLLIPVEHTPTLKSIKDEQEQEKTIKTMQAHRAALQNMIAMKSKDADDVAQLGAVTYEISRAGGVHMQWQLVPIPVEMINKGQIEAGFEMEAETNSYPKYAKGEDEIRAAKEGDYFRVMIWTETFQREMVLPLDASFRFDLQYGRKVLAKLLRLDSRMDWRKCEQSKEEEAADATKFREMWKEFDPFAG